MGRVFWHSFLTIWLTMAGAIAIMAVANAYLQILPPKDQFIDTREMFTLEGIGGYLAEDNFDGAVNFTHVMSRRDPPIDVTIEKVADRYSNECTFARTNLVYAGKQPPDDMRGIIRPDGGIAKAYAHTDKNCYRVTLKKTRLSPFERYAPAVMPFVAGLMASVVSSFLLANYLVSPIMKLRTGLNTLAGGVFSVRIGNKLGRRRDEIATLGKDFDTTAAKLEELDTAQKRLFHDVSHELRSPLSRLQAAVGLLKKNSSKLDALLPRMEREIQRQDGLVEEILTLARLGPTSPHTLERQTIDVLDLLNAVVDDATFEAQPKGITVDFEGPDSFVTCVNGELIYRAIENVVRNAVKYSMSDCSIHVQAQILAGEDALSIRIANQGVVVPARDLEKIFQPFTRLQENEAGYGLGLAITRRAIQAHGGRVEAISNTGGGLTVTLVVPRLS
jgi:two-component system OmpR family sensor kinase